MDCTTRDLKNFVIGLGTEKNFADFPFEVEGCGEFVVLDAEGDDAQFEFELDEVAKFEKAELEAVLAVRLPGCTICGKA